jgi:anaerobic magnesium-protoporphyrin IX monomethyl ester cyclase
VKILLIYPAFRTQSHSIYFPFGLAYVASVLAQAGHAVQVLDLEGEGLSLAQAAERISHADFDLVGLGGMVTRYAQVKELVPLLRRCNPNAVIVAGNSGASTVPHLYLRNAGVDICVMGEGEQTMRELAGRLQQGKDWHDVPGLAWREGEEVKYSPPRPVLADLDELPYPAWDLFPIERYVSSPDHRQPHRTLDVVASRGCPFSCRFCYSIYGHKIRRRQPAKLLEEIDEITARYHLRHFGFVDDLFTSDKKFVAEFCELKLAQGNRTIWSCLGRVDTLDPATLQKMHEAGCRHLALGIESGSQAMLDAMKKNATVEENRRAVELCRAAGISPHPSFIVGTPGETAQTVRESVEFCKKLGLTTTFHIMTPYPGSYFYAQAQEQGLVSDEDAFVSSLGTATELYLNISGLPDDELFRLKHEGEMEILRHFMLHHPFKFTHEYITRNLRLLGFGGLLRKIFSRQESAENAAQADHRA